MVVMATAEVEGEADAVVARGGIAGPVVVFFADGPVVVVVVRVAAIVCVVIGGGRVAVVVDAGGGWFLAGRGRGGLGDVDGSYDGGGRGRDLAVQGGEHLFAGLAGGDRLLGDRVVEGLQGGGCFGHRSCQCQKSKTCHERQGPEVGFHS